MATKKKDSDRVIQAKPLYTVEEVSYIIQTNPNYVSQLFKAKLLTPLKLGRYKVRHEELMTFLEKWQGHDLTDPFNIKSLNC